MAQAVSRQPLIAEAQIRSRDSQCGIYNELIGTGTGSYPSSSVFPCQYHSTLAPYSYITLAMKNGPVGGRSSETQSHSIDVNNIGISLVIMYSLGCLVCSYSTCIS